MKLRTKLVATKGVLYLAGGILLLSATYHSVGWLPLFVLWIVQKPRVLHRWILPLLFRYATCTNKHCRRQFDLVQRWQVGESYKHNCECHLLCVYDDAGREIGWFECPECNATQPVQKGGRSKYAKGAILGNALSVSYGEKGWWWAVRQLISNPVTGASSSQMPLGIDRTARMPWLLRWLYWLCGRKTGRPVTVPESVFNAHMNIFGKSGMGKSTLIQSQFQWICETGQGATIIDPAGDLVDDLLRLVPEHRKDDVLLVRPRDLDCPFQFNILETFDVYEEINLNHEILECLRSVSRGWGDVIAHNVDLAIDTAKAINGSMRDVYDLFTDEAARTRIAPKLDDPELIDFWDNWGGLSSTATMPTVRKVRSLVKHRLLGRMISAESTNLNYDTIIAEGKIVLVDLDTRTTAKWIHQTLGTLLITKIVSAAFRQKKRERRRHFVIVDEASNYMHEGMNFGHMLSYCRKYLLTLVLATQTVSQLREDVQKQSFGNSGVILSFAVAQDDAEKLRKETFGTTARDFQLQDIGECVAKIRNTPYWVKTMRPTKPPVDQTEYITKRMKKLSESTTVIVPDPEELHSPTSVEVAMPAIINGIQ